MLLAILAAAAVAAGADAPQPASPAGTEVAPATAVAPPKPEKKKDDVVCVSERMTGSNRMTKVCYNKRERREETRDALANQHTRDSTTPGIGASR